MSDYSMEKDTKEYFFKYTVDFVQTFLMLSSSVLRAFALSTEISWFNDLICWKTNTLIYFSNENVIHKFSDCSIQ